MLYKLQRNEPSVYVMHWVIGSGANHCPHVIGWEANHSPHVIGSEANHCPHVIGWEANHCPHVIGWEANHCPHVFGWEANHCPQVIGWEANHCRHAKLRLWCYLPVVLCSMLPLMFPASRCCDPRLWCTASFAVGVRSATASLLATPSARCCPTLTTSRYCNALHTHDCLVLPYSHDFQVL